MNVTSTMETVSKCAKICMADIAVHVERDLFWTAIKGLVQVKDSSIRIRRSFSSCNIVDFIVMGTLRQFYEQLASAKLKL